MGDRGGHQTPFFFGWGTVFGKLGTGLHSCIQGAIKCRFGSRTLPKLVRAGSGVCVPSCGLRRSSRAIKCPFGSRFLPSLRAGGAGGPGGHGTFWAFSQSWCSSVSSGLANAAVCLSRKEWMSSGTRSSFSALERPAKHASLPTSRCVCTYWMKAAASVRLASAYGYTTPGAKESAISHCSCDRLTPVHLRKPARFSRPHGGTQPQD